MLQPEADSLPPVDILIIDNSANKKYTICSDIHGFLPHFKMLAKNHDREFTIIIAGDLPDRGPETIALVYFIIEYQKKYDANENVPKILIALGNHELMFLCWLYSIKNAAERAKKLCEDLLPPTLEAYRLKEFQEQDEKWLNLQNTIKNMKLRPEDSEIFLARFGEMIPANLHAYLENPGTKWVADATPEQLAEMFTFFVSLPFIIHVKGEFTTNSFTVVHAGIPEGVSLQTITTSQYLTREQKNYALWAREKTRRSENDTQLLESESSIEGAVICGHTPFELAMRNTINCAKIYNIDGAIFFTNRLPFIIIDETGKYLGFIANDNPESKLQIISFYGEDPRNFWRSTLGINTAMLQKFTRLARELTPAYGPFRNYPRNNAHFFECNKIYIDAAIKKIESALEEIFRIAENCGFALEILSIDEVYNKIKKYFKLSSWEEKTEQLYLAYIEFNSLDFAANIELIEDLIDGEIKVIEGCPISDLQISPTNLSSKNPSLFKPLSLPLQQIGPQEQLITNYKIIANEFAKILNIFIEEEKPHTICCCNA